MNKKIGEEKKFVGLCRDCLQQWAVHKPAIILPLLIGLCLLFAGPVISVAQELTVLQGATNDIDSPNRSFAYQVDYRHGITENLALGASYLNEGHLPNHHRDGLAPVILWGRINTLNRRLSLAAGGGPYLYADTTTPQGKPPQDQHDVGGLLGLSATLYLDYRLLLQARVNWVLTEKTINTVTTLVGVGFQFEEGPSPGPVSRPTPAKERTAWNEITGYLGETAVNTPGSPKSLAWSVEYRRGLLQYLDVSAAWLNEGDNRLIRRNGLLTELWLVRSFLEDHVSLGGGFGAYVAVDKRGGPHPEEGGSSFASGVLSATAAAYNFPYVPGATLRFVFNRIVTNYDRDTDTFMFGVGYRF